MFERRRLEAEGEGGRRADVNRRVANPAGRDRIVAVGRTARGAVCRGALTF
jgi:hypothetical protein